MEDTILRGLTGVCPREPGGQGPGGAAGSLLHGPISHRGPHHPGGHGPEEEGREGSKTEPMPSRAPAAKASRMSPPGLRREVCREPRAASLASPCLLSFPTWSSSVPEPSAPGRPPKAVGAGSLPRLGHLDPDCIRRSHLSSMAVCHLWGLFRLAGLQSAPENDDSAEKRKMAVMLRSHLWDVDGGGRCRGRHGTSGLRHVLDRGAGRFLRGGRDSPSAPPPALARRPRPPASRTSGRCAGLSGRGPRFKRPGRHRPACTVELSRGLFAALLTLPPRPLQAPTRTRGALRNASAVEYHSDRESTAAYGFARLSGPSGTSSDPAVSKCPAVQKVLGPAAEGRRLRLEAPAALTAALSPDPQAFSWGRRAHSPGARWPENGKPGGLSLPTGSGIRTSGSGNEAEGSTVNLVGGSEAGRGGGVWSRVFRVQILSVPCDRELPKGMGHDLSHRGD